MSLASTFLATGATATPPIHDLNAIAVIGGGPAGLMAAQVLSEAGRQVHLFDAMPSVGRKFLLAGKGGLNLTHSEPAPGFASRYGARTGEVAPWLDTFDADAVRAWARGLGVDTFVGTSGRVFPVDLKAAPLLRAWLHRLRHPTNGVPVLFHMRHRWLGWSNADPGTGTGAGAPPLRFATPQGERSVQVAAVVLALGGASWPQLGSDGAWVPVLSNAGVPVAPLLPANCGFDVGGVGALDGAAPGAEGAASVALAPDHEAETRRDFLLELFGRKPPPPLGWSEHFASRFAGQPFKSVAIALHDAAGRPWRRKGEFVATATGVEGSLIYAASAHLRDAIAVHGSAVFHLDLLPDRSADDVLVQVRHPRGSRSLSSHLKSRLGLDGIKAAVLHEVLGPRGLDAPERLAAAIKALPIRLIAPRPLAEAISTAGGVGFDALDGHAMLKALPGTFCAGEMIDWEAPTGGYLMTASLASGRAAALGVLAVISPTPGPNEAA